MFQDPEIQEVQLRETNGPLGQFNGASSTPAGKTNGVNLTSSQRALAFFPRAHWGGRGPTEPL